jgi:FO synthase
MNLPSPEAPLNRADAEELVRAAVEEGCLERAVGERLAAHLRDPVVFEVILEGALESTHRGKGRQVSFSRNVFIPLTNLCRDRCSYCTFAKPPDSPEAKTYTVDEVAEVARGGMRTGCIEALFCLGDKPEVAYRQHREWLASQGFASTADHLVEACRIAFEAGMLPHTNAGILGWQDMERLRRWNASMGLMLESTSQRLRQRDMPHYHAPDKEPALRLRMHEEAGEIGIPFTTGMLLGIGETDAERIDTLLVIRDLADRHGHIQEVILQPFHPKPGTRMRAQSSLPEREIAGWVALARLALGPDQNVQAPPNLSPDALELLMRAGANDWGGVSPVTVDFINPEAPWPTLAELLDRTTSAGRELVERLPVYPEHLLGRPELFDPSVRAAALRMADERGFARPRTAFRREEAA